MSKVPLRDIGILNLKCDLPLIVSTDGIEGFESEVLTNWMSENGLLLEWQNWFSGQTGAIVDGKFLVYKYDVDRFLSNGPVLD
jgi:hypothetical protein